MNAPERRARAASAGDHRPIAPGLRPVVDTLDQAVAALNRATADADAARAALTGLVIRPADGDWQLAEFLEAALATPGTRLADAVAGLIQEHRTLVRLSGELGLVNAADQRDLGEAFNRIEALTAAYRSEPLVRPELAAQVETAASSATGSPQWTGVRPGEPAGGRASGVDRRNGEATAGHDDEVAAETATQRLGRRLRQLMASRGSSAWPAGESRTNDEGTVTGSPRRPADAVAADRAPALAPEARPAEDDERTAASPGDDDIAAGGGAASAGGASWFMAGAEDDPVVADVEPDAGMPEVGPSSGEVVSPRDGDPDRPGDPAGDSIAAFRSVRAVRPTKPQGRLGRRASGLTLAIIPPAILAVTLAGMPGASASRAVPSAPATWTVSEPSEPPAGDDLAVIGAEGPAVAPISPDAKLPTPVATAIAASTLATTTAPLAQVVFSGSSHAKVVALTFDDGYSAANTKAIFDILVREKVPATFFANGYVFSRGPAVWKAIANAGYPVANHTYSHVDVRRLTDEAIRRELQDTATAFESTTGVAMTRLFRPPFGAHDARTDAVVTAADYSAIVLWNTTDADTSAGITAQAATDAALKGGNGAIVLLHAGPDLTPHILPAIIAGYRARGFGFVTVPDLLAQ